MIAECARMIALQRTLSYGTEQNRHCVVIVVFVSLTAGHLFFLILAEGTELYWRTLSYVEG
mgnify:CR=1 FL=1